MTPEERARHHVAEMERCGFTVREDLEYELEACIRAALRERDAAWKEAMLGALGNGAVAAITLSGHPAVAPLRELLEEAEGLAPQAPPDPNQGNLPGVE